MSRDSDLRVFLSLRGTTRPPRLDGCRRTGRTRATEPLDLRTIRAGWQLNQHGYR